MSPLYLRDLPGLFIIDTFRSFVNIFIFQKIKKLQQHREGLRVQKEDREACLMLHIVIDAIMLSWVSQRQCAYFDSQSCHITPCIGLDLSQFSMLTVGFKQGWSGWVVVWNGSLELNEEVLAGCGLCLAFRGNHDTAILTSVAGILWVTGTPGISVF